MILIFCCLWGLLEAVCFPVAADVILTYLSFQGLSTGLFSMQFVLIGALFGGAFMHKLGKTRYEMGMRWATLLPGVFPNMVNQVKSTLQKRGLFDMVIGSLIGIPYKVYALETAHVLQTPLWLFLLVSIPARLLRFSGVCCLISLIDKYLPASFVYRFEALTLFWIIFYAFYIRKMSRWKRSPIEPPHD